MHRSIPLIQKVVVAQYRAHYSQTFFIEIRIVPLAYFSNVLIFSTMLLVFYSVFTKMLFCKCQTADVIWRTPYGRYHMANVQFGAWTQHIQNQPEILSIPSWQFLEKMEFDNSYVHLEFRFVLMFISDPRSSKFGISIKFQTFGCNIVQKAWNLIIVMSI